MVCPQQITVSIPTSHQPAPRGSTWRSVSSRSHRHARAEWGPPQPAGADRRTGEVSSPTQQGTEALHLDGPSQGHPGQGHSRPSKAQPAQTQRSLSRTTLGRIAAQRAQIQHASQKEGELLGLGGIVPGADDAGFRAQPALVGSRGVTSPWRGLSGVGAWNSGGEAVGRRCA